MQPTILKVAETVSGKGTTMIIVDTDIKLTIPSGAFKGYRYIELSVVPFVRPYESAFNFSKNSSVVLELLPNKATFSKPVKLTIPHCFKLRPNFKKDSVKVYLSHHETGKSSLSISLFCMIQF